MFTKKQRHIQNKIIPVQLYDEEGSFTLHQLSDRMRGSLLAISEYLNWKNRLVNIPEDLQDDAVFHEWLDDVRERLMIPVELCAEMINCINNDGDTQNALKTYILNLAKNDADFRSVLNQNAGLPNAENNMSDSGYNLIPDTYECDTNKVVRSIDTLVEWLNQNNRDFLQSVNNASTPASRATQLSGQIPNFSGGALGAEFGAVIGFITGALNNNYEAYSDTTYLNGLKCEIYNEATCINECTLSTIDIYRILAVRVGYTDTARSFYRGLLFTVSGEIIDINFADVMMFIQLGSFLYMNGFIEFVGVNPLINALTNGQDDGSNDYLSTCTPCAEQWCKTITLADHLPVIVHIDNGEFVTDGIGDVLVDANGFHHYRVVVSVNFVSDVHLRSLSMTYDLTKGGFSDPSPNVVNGFYTVDAFGAQVGHTFIQSDLDTDGTDKVLSDTGNLLCRGIVFIVHCSREVVTTDPGNTVLKSVTICGEGTEPDWSE